MRNYPESTLNSKKSRLGFLKIDKEYLDIQEALKLNQKEERLRLILSLVTLLIS